MPDPLDLVRSLFGRAAEVQQRFAARGLPSVVEAAALIEGVLAAGGKALVFGNGGSAADAQHFAAELVGRFEAERPGLPVVALTTDTSILTAVSNDYEYARVFARQVEALGRSGDVAMGISTSGQSANVEQGLAAARAKGLRTVALTGRDGGPIGAGADVHVNVPDDSAARVQEVHIVVLHALCALIESGATGRRRRNAT